MHMRLLLNVRSRLKDSPYWTRTISDSREKTHRRIIREGGWGYLGVWHTGQGVRPMILISMKGVSVSSGELYTMLFKKAMEGAPDCGGLVSFNYYAGEPVTGLEEGRPMLLRLPDADLSLANFMRAQLFARMETLKYGMEILNREHVAIDCVYGHGGLFKTEGVAQNLLSAAIHAPVTVMQTAGEGGAWGIALLAEYLVKHASGESLEDYLDQKVFAGMTRKTVSPDPQDEAGFDAYMERFVACIPAQQAAVRALKA